MQLIALASFLPLVVSVATQGAEDGDGPCTKARREAGQPMPGKLIPVCTEHGYFQPVQCHGSTGRCWCVIPDNGEEVVGTSTFRTGPPQCSLCHVKRAEALRPFGFVGNFVPACTKDGVFRLTQVHPSTGHTWCVDKKSGKEIEGTRRAPGSQQFNCELLDVLNLRRSVSDGPCTKAKMDAGKPMPGRFIPECTEYGFFKPIQCHGSTGRCWCVVPDNGEEVLGTATMRTGSPNCSSCYTKRAEELRPRGYVGHYVPACTKDGLFQATQFHPSSGHCWCVDRNTGIEIEGTRRAPSSKDRVNCEELSNLKDKKPQEQGPCATKLASLAPGRVGLYKPACTPNGFYRTEQFHGSTGYSWCVNPATGDEVKDTRRGPTQPQVTCGACFKEIEEKLSTKRVMGLYLPQCDESSGDYSAMQLHEGHRWCVNPKTGDVEGPVFGPGDSTPLPCE